MTVARLEGERRGRRIPRVDDRDRRDAGLAAAVRPRGTTARRRTPGPPTRSSPAAAAARPRSCRGVSTRRPRRNRQAGLVHSSSSVASGSTQPARLGDGRVELGDRRRHRGRRLVGPRALRLADLGGERGERVLVRRAAAAPSGRPSTAVTAAGERLGAVARAVRVVGLAPHGSAKQRRVVPERHAVGAPLERDVPARQRLARVPLALAAVHDPARGVRRAQPLGELVGELALLAGRRRRCSTAALVASSSDDEGRLAAHRQAHVARVAAARRPPRRARRCAPTAASV